MAIEEFGLENDDVKSNNFQKFKGEKGKEYRVGLVAEDLNKGFLGAKTHYIEGIGTIVCKSTSDAEALCCSHGYEGNTPKWKIGISIIVYNLSSDGTKLESYKVIPWIFNDRIYNQLKTQHQEWGLDQNDLLLKCTDSQYQSFEISLKKGCVWRKNSKIKEECLAEAEKQRKQIKRNLGRDVSNTELKEALGIGDGIGDAAAEVDLGDVADILD